MSQKLNIRNNKDKLTYILRCEQKRYYSNLLEEHKCNMKKAWQVLNQCINKSKKAQVFLIIL